MWWNNITHRVSHSSMFHGISTLFHQAKFVSYNFNCHSIVFSLVCPHSDPKSSKAIKTNGEATSDMSWLPFGVVVMQLKIKKTCISYGKTIVHGEGASLSRVGPYGFIVASPWTNLPFWGIVLGWALTGFAVMATPRPSHTTMVRPNFVR